MERREFIRHSAIGLATLATAWPYGAKADKSEDRFVSRAPRPQIAGRMPATRYKVAVIGRTGRGNYGHGLDVVWNDVEGAQVVAVADEDAKGRAAAAERLNAPRTYADYRRMLDKERPHIVSVAPRWLDCHRDMVLACAEFGCHVFLEKPICQTLEQADEMVAALEKKNLKLAMAHQTRYSPTLEHARRLMAEGGLGDIIELRGRGKEDRRGGGEDLMVLGTHVMDLMRLFAGNPQWCFARVRDKGKPVTKKEVRDGAEGIGPLAGDEIHATYRLSRASCPRFEGGTSSPPTMGYFSTHRAKHGAAKRFGLTIYGTKGILTTTTGALPEVWFVEDPSWQPGRSKTRWKRISSNGINKPETKTDTGQAFGNHLIALDLLHAIETNTQPKGSVYDGRAALEMILAVYESHRLNAPATFPLKIRKHPLVLL